MKPRFSLEQWYVLQAVVDCGGYAQAAEKLHRSQSSLSYSVAKLQQQLGTRLLYIDGRKARLTDAGKTLLRQARQLLDDADQLVQVAESLEQGWETEISLVVDAAYPTDKLMHALKTFAPVSNGTRVQLDEVVLSGAEDALLDGRADIAITHKIPPHFLGDAIIAIEFICVAHPKHPLHQVKRALNYEDLQREMQVVVRDSGADQRFDAGWLGAEHRWTVSSIDTAITTICQGLGFSWVPLHKIHKLLAAKQLKPLNLTSGQRYFTDLYMVVRQPNHAGPATMALANLINQQSHRKILL